MGGDRMEDFDNMSQTHTGTIIKQFRENTSRSLIIVSSVILFVAAVLCIVLQSDHGVQDDVINFYTCAEMIKDGLMPYRDFVFEFPPFSLIFFLIPSIFTSDLGTYVFLYSLEVVVMAIVTLAFLLKIADRMKLNKYLVTTIFMTFVIMYLYQAIRKFDMSMLMIVTISLYLYLDQKYTLSYGVMMFGALTKMYPGLLIIIMLIVDVLRYKNVNRALKGMGACMVLAIVSVIPLLLMSVPLTDILSFINFHADRGFHIESVVGIVIQAMGALGLTTFQLVGAHFTYDVVGPISVALLPYWGIVTTTSLTVTFVLIALHARKSRTENEQNIARNIQIYFMAIVTVFLLVNKVFSTQYVMWLYALFAVLSIYHDTKINVPVLISTFTVVATSVLIIMFYMPSELFVPINLIRDLALLYLVIQALLFLLRKKSIFDNDTVVVSE